MMDDFLWFYTLEISYLGVEVTKCYENFYSCMEKSAIDAANDVFVGDNSFSDYHG